MFTLTREEINIKDPTQTAHIIYLFRDLNKAKHALNEEFKKAIIYLSNKAETPIDPNNTKIETIPLKDIKINQNHFLSNDKGLGISLYITKTTPYNNK